MDLILLFLTLMHRFKVAEEHTSNAFGSDELITWTGAVVIIYQIDTNLSEVAGHPDTVIDI